ncbi:MAG: serine O-acetyltransferase [Alphaproteobacteria bacterium]|nr:serine O-acetyltransferase [Alphaproteobacteria bacterium]
MTENQKSDQSLYESMCEDLRATNRRSGFPWFILYLFLVPGYLMIFLYRVSSICARKKIFGAMLARLFWRINVLLVPCDISFKSKIGPGFCAPHPLGIVIGEKVVIGRNVTIYQNVTLGLRHSGAGRDAGEFPVVGDDVKIFSGAVIVGKISVGDGACIGANSVVTKDFPANSTVAGSPARVISLRAG